jgi:hypothetical protein
MSFIEDQVLSDGHSPHEFAESRLPLAKRWHLAQLLELPIKPLDKAICRTRVVLGDVHPDRM